MTPLEVRASLNQLPPAHTKEQIMDLIEALQSDLQKDAPGLNFTQTIHHHSSNHKELFFSYPMLFRSVCKRTYRPLVLDILLDAKLAMEAARKTKKRHWMR
jgi:hypothetical protein